MELQYILFTQYLNLGIIKMTNAENSVTIMRKEDMFMNKKRIMSLISILVPVAIAAIGEFSDQLDAKEMEEEMEDINKRIKALEAKQNEEAQGNLGFLFSLEGEKTWKTKYQTF